ncbi:MAG: CobD/CbiB family cobalamin biosynthesis protein, partial [Fibrobacter sp.]|nr:CobD/CbiB family cobalamin biosynthesis protein [Fibrobacter sp.]
MLSSSFFIIILIDFFLGDPYWLPHPVRWTGHLISVSERMFYPDNGNCARKGFAGIVTCVFVTAVVCGAGGLFLFLCKQISGEVYRAGGIIIGFYCLSGRSLVTESLIVRKYLLKNDIERARYAVSRIVGRDSANMDSEQVSRAAVETIAENIVDGIISPLFYLILGGPVAALAFKAISTMDSMIGY